jgi:pyruvate dehydrogenase E2 component (dihydrolipoamide acetyltransferase)
MYSFKLPDLGEGIHEGEVLKWFVKVGDFIKEDDPLVEVETDKAAVTIPSPKGGRVVALNGEVGGTVKTGSVIAVIDDGSGEAAAPLPAPARQAGPPVPPKAKAALSARQAGAAGAAQTQRAPQTPIPTCAPRGAGPVPAAPATRRLARELGVDIQQVRGSGPAGRVTTEDVKRFAQGGSPAAAPEPDEGASTPAWTGGPSAIPFLQLEPMPDFAQWGPVEKEPLRSIRRKVAIKMTTSMSVVPHVGHADDADVSLLEEFRDGYNRRHPDQPKLTLIPFILKGLAEGLKAHPMLNASLDPARNEIVYKKYYNIGIAVDSGKGLVVPVLKGVDQLAILQIAAGVRDLATRARENRLDAADFRGGTFTLTNVGAIGGRGLVPVINYPEVAILGMGRTEEKPVVRNGRIVIRSILPLSLGFDHRVADGADAARFMNAVIAYLQQPLNFLMEH